MRRWLLGLACVVAGVLTVSCCRRRPRRLAAGHPHRPSDRPVADHRAARRRLPRPAGAAGTTTTSSNWAGYDDSTDGPFTSVTATWTQPRVRTTGATFTDAAFWVGLDGDNSDTVEQIGTEGYSEGVAGYDAWYEMYPLLPVTIDMPIHPGDVLTGTVT